MIFRYFIKIYRLQFQAILISEGPPIILYQYTRSRSGDHARAFLDGFNGYHVSNAYAGYEKVEGITRCLCFSHLRRYYLDATPLDSGKKEIPGSGGAIGRAYCDKLFKFERKWKELSPEKRKKEKRTGLYIVSLYWIPFLHGQKKHSLIRIC